MMFSKKTPTFPPQKYMNIFSFIITSNARNTPKTKMGYFNQ